MKVDVCLHLARMNALSVYSFCLSLVMSPAGPHQLQQQQTSARNDDAQQPVVYTLLRKRRVYYDNYCCRQSMCAGTMLLITGLLSVVLQSVSIAAGLILSAVCHGIWCGVMVSRVLRVIAYTLSYHVMSGDGVL